MGWIAITVILPNNCVGGHINYVTVNPDNSLSFNTGKFDLLNGETLLDFVNIGGVKTNERPEKN